MAGLRTVLRRRRQYAGERCGLGDIDLAEALAEIDLCGGRDAVGALPEKHLVEEERHDLFLGERLLDLPGEERLAEFSRKQLLTGQEIVAGQLLGNRAAAAGNLSFFDKENQRAQDSLVVDAGMLEEPAVFRRHEGIDDKGWQVVVVDNDSTPLADLFNQASVTAVNPQRNLQGNVPDGFRGRQARRDVVVSANNGRRCGHAHGNTQPQRERQPAGFAPFPSIGTGRNVTCPSILHGRVCPGRAG